MATSIDGFIFPHQLTLALLLALLLSSTFQISFFLSSYVIPLTLISILYVGMLIRLWHNVPGSKASSESR